MKRASFQLSTGLCLALVCSTAGCYQSHQLPGPTAADAGRDAAPRVDSGEDGAVDDAGPPQGDVRL